MGLLEVVRALGEYITSTEDDVRRKGELTSKLQSCSGPYAFSEVSHF